MDKIGILGAGAIGCFIGGILPAGSSILIGRETVLAPIDDAGLRLTGQIHCRRSPGEIETSISPAALQRCGIICVATKTTGLDQVIGDIRANAPQGAVVISFLNGVRAARALQDGLPGFRVLRGMVPYNVVWQGPTHLHRSSKGKIAVEPDPVTDRLAAAFASQGEALHITDQIEAIQYGKLLLNLVNPVNALSGMNLHPMLQNRAWRRIYAAALREALAVYGAAGVSYRKTGPFPPALIARLLLAPDILFNNIMLPMQALDPQSKTSMAQDYERGKPTEIDDLTGEIIQLAQSIGMEAPINTAIMTAIRSGRRNWDPDQFWTHFNQS